MNWGKNISSIRNIKCTTFQIGNFFQSKRWKNGPNHWATLKNKKTAADVALEHFDDFYKSVYGDTWNSIRVALLTRQKYCAVINNFDNSEATSSFLESEGAFNMRNVLESRSAMQNKESSDRNRNIVVDSNNEMNKKLEGIAKRKKQEELQELYPENSDFQDTSRMPEDVSDGIDWSRQVDPQSGLSASALYDFVPANKLKGREDFVSESEHFSFYEKYLQVPIETATEENLKFPEHLQVYSFEPSNMSYFQSPRRGVTGVYNYYLMNASSILPVLALNLSPGDWFLDMCAAPGGKSVVALQTLYPDLVVCNDSSRTTRLKRVIDDYFYDVDERVKVTTRDARTIDEVDVFNKILVDVPCTSDRRSVIKDYNNLFKSTKLKYRLNLPELQAGLLSTALKIVKVGGTVVYSTCSLSPIQNDGVVQMALRQIWEETRHKFLIVNMKNALEPSKIFFRFGDSYGLRYGHIVLPYLPSNFGPLYFCKLVRVQ